MNRETLEYVVEKTRELIQAPTCFPGGKRRGPELA